MRLAVLLLVSGLFGWLGYGANNAFAQAEQDSRLFSTWRSETDSVSFRVPATLTPRGLNELARRAKARFSFTTAATVNNCSPQSLPGLLQTQSRLRFVESGAEILIHYDDIAIERVIYLSPGGGPAVQDPSSLGCLSVVGKTRR